LLLSDGAGDQIVVACSAGEVTVNGQFVDSNGEFVAGGGADGLVRCDDPHTIAVDGKGGNDTIDLAGVSRAAGFRLFTLSGRPYLTEIDGGDGADEIVGTGYQDAIGVYVPQSGPDTIRGGAGGDEIGGTPASDTIFGEGGGDDIYCARGNDRADGGPGADHLDGEKGNDRIHGRDGADELYGSRGADFLYGEKGNDRLIGGAGFDRLFPGIGRNTVIK
jgi:Ca2+-binding RTX toxin-like protein